MRGIHRWPGDSPHKGPVTQKSVSCQDVIMFTSWFMLRHSHCGKVLFNCMDENLSIFWIIVIQVYAFWHFLLIYLLEFVSCFIQIMSLVLYHRWVYLESWGSFCKYFAITYHGYAMKRFFSYFYLFIWKQLALNKRAWVVCSVLTLHVFCLLEETNCAFSQCWFKSKWYLNSAEKNVLNWNVYLCQSLPEISLNEPTSTCYEILNSLRPSNAYVHQ